MITDLLDYGSSSSLNHRGELSMTLKRDHLPHWLALCTISVKQALSLWDGFKMVIAFQLKFEIENILQVCPGTQKGFYPLLLIGPYKQPSFQLPVLLEMVLTL